MLPYVVFYAFAASLALIWWFAVGQGTARRWLWPVGGLLVVWFWYWGWTQSEPPTAFSDFDIAYYPAGRTVVHNLPELFTRCSTSPVCGFVNIPIVAFLFTPLSMLTLRHAHWGFLGLSVISLLLTLWLLWSVTDRNFSRRGAVLLLVALNGPLLNSLKEGNLTHFVLLLLVAGVLCLDRDWPRTAGACFALAAVIKLPLLLFAAYFVGTRRWPVVVGYGAALLVMVASSLGYAGWQSHVEWYREVIQPFSHQGIAAFNVQSIEGILLRLAGEGSLYDWQPVPVSPDIRMTGRALAALLVGGSAMLFLRAPGRRVRETLYLELSMVLCLALIISPISWTHYYLLLLLPLSLYVGNRLPVSASGGCGAVLCLSVVMVFPPVTFAWPNGFPTGPVASLLLSHYGIGALLLWGLLAYERWRVEEVHHLQLVTVTRESRQGRQAPSVPLSAEPDESSDRKIAG